MSKETDEEIALRLASRKSGVKLEPLPVTASPTRLDVEDAYDDTVLTRKAPPLSKIEPVAFDSVPE